MALSRCKIQAQIEVQALPIKHHHKTFPVFPGNDASSVWHHSSNSADNAFIKKPNQHSLHLGYDMLAFFGLRMLFSTAWFAISFLDHTETTIIHCDQGQIKGWARYAASQGTNFYGALKQHRNNHKYGASEPWFPNLRKILWNFSALWAMCPLWKSLKNASLKGN
jgi:hypothetical protein